MAKKTALSEKFNEEAVSRKEFDELKENQGKILDLLENMNKAPSVSAAIVDPVPVESTYNKPATGGAQGGDAFIPPHYRKMFEHYFDPNDGFDFKLSFPEVDENGRESGGITCTIVVPQKFSNASSAHKALYKQDLRTKALSPSNIAGGIEAWCKLVALNLKYDKNNKTK